MRVLHEFDELALGVDICSVCALGAEMHEPSSPAPSVEVSWLASAACRGRGELFFAPPGERPEAREVREHRAAVLCSKCPVAEQCAEYANELAGSRPRSRYFGLHGVWAGFSYDTGVPLLRRAS